MLGFTYGQPNLLDLMLLKKSLNLRMRHEIHKRHTVYRGCDRDCCLISNSSNFGNYFGKNDECAFAKEAELTIYRSRK